MRLLATGCSHPRSSASDSSPMASSAWHQMKPHCLHQLIYQTLISSQSWRACSLPCTNQPSFLSFVSYNYTVMTLWLNIGQFTFNIWKYVLLRQKIQPDTLFFQCLELTGHHFMALTGPKVLTFSTEHWTRRSCRCSAPSTAGLCNCLWRCLLQFGGLPPPARPSARPVLDAVIKHPLPQ